MSRSFSVLSLACATLALLACGGGGSGASNGPAGPPEGSNRTISGTAAAGSPVIGTVTVRDSLGAQRTVTIRDDGRYTVDVGGMTGPFYFRAAGKVGGRDVALSSAATVDDVGGVINITPFTDLIVANIAGRAVDNALTGLEYARLTTAELNAARATLTERVLPVLRELGVSDSFDLLRTGFAADHTQFDAVMDVLKVSVDPATHRAVILDLVNQQQIEDDLASRADATVITAPPAGSLAGPVSDLQQIDALLRAFSELFRAQQPAPTNTALLAMLAPDFMHYGSSLDELLAPGNMPPVGTMLSSPVLVRRIDARTLLVRFDTLDPGYGTEADEMIFRKDDTDRWRLAGNQWIVDADIDSINHRFVFNTGETYSRHLEIWLEGARADVQRATVSGPGLAGRLQLRRSVTTPTGNFTWVDSQGQERGSWVPECAAPQTSDCIDFAQMPIDAHYTVTLLDATGAALGAPITLTVERPPVSNASAQANAQQWFANYTVSPSNIAAWTDGTPVTFQWTAPQAADYRVSSMGLGTASRWFNADALLDDPSRSTQVATWTGAAPAWANTWVHVQGPSGRHFVTGRQLP